METIESGGGGNNIHAYQSSSNSVGAPPDLHVGDNTGFSTSDSMTVAVAIQTDQGIFFGVGHWESFAQKPLGDSGQPQIPGGSPADGAQPNAFLSGNGMAVAMVLAGIAAMITAMESTAESTRQSLLIQQETWDVGKADASMIERSAEKQAEQQRLEAGKQIATGVIAVGAVGLQANTLRGANKTTALAGGAERLSLKTAMISGAQSAGGGLIGGGIDIASASCTAEKGKMDKQEAMLRTFMEILKQLQQSAEQLGQQHHDLMDIFSSMSGAVSANTQATGRMMVA